MECRVSIQWTETALDTLRTLPKRVRRGLFDKADDVAAGGDPRKTCKPLAGPLSGYYRITYGRYRAVFTVEEESLASGDTLLHVKMRFVVAGIRKERDKNDVYRVAEKLVKLMMLNEGESLGGISGVGDSESQ